MVGSGEWELGQVNTRSASSVLVDPKESRFFEVPQRSFQSWHGRHARALGMLLYSAWAHLTGRPDGSRRLYHWARDYCMVASADGNAAAGRERSRRDRSG